MESQLTDKLLDQTLERLRKLEETIQQIQKRIEQIETKQPPPRDRADQPNPQAIHEIDLMNLPDSLRRTMMAIAKLGEATPEEVAEETSRTRGLENLYLNQLERLGHIEKVRRGKRVYYRSLRII